MSKDYCVCCNKELGIAGDSDEKYKTLVLNGGDIWLDFCDKCGYTETLTNGDTGEVLTFNELYNQNNE